MDVILYTTGCPKCKMLEGRLDEKGINYEKCDDMDKMENLGLMSAPNLSVDGEIMNFGKAIKWLNEMEG